MSLSFPATRCIPYLDDESNGDDGDAVVGDVMATAVRCVPDVAPHAAALSCLEDTRHNAFPVLAAGCAEFNHWFGWSRPNFRIL